MSTFRVYFDLGLDHLLDIQAVDHVLYVAVLCASQKVARWRTLVALVTAFTVGHSLSLALATMEVIRVSSHLIETLIPVTILAGAAHNLLSRQALDRVAKGAGWSYGATLFFGLIHGLGFSNFLKLVLGEERSLFIPLLAFNLGLEAAQLILACGFLLIALLFVIGRAKERWWEVGVSGIAGAVAAGLLAQRLFWGE